METIHTVLIWLAAWVASSVILSPLLGKWIKNTNYSFEDFPTQLPSESLRDGLKVRDSDLHVEQPGDSKEPLTKKAAA
jgi:hypothetical protein